MPFDEVTTFELSTPLGAADGNGVFGPETEKPGEVPLSDGVYVGTSFCESDGSSTSLGDADGDGDVEPGAVPLSDGLVGSPFCDPLGVLDGFDDELGLLLEGHTDSAGSSVGPGEPCGKKVGICVVGADEGLEEVVMGKPGVIVGINVVG